MSTLVRFAFPNGEDKGGLEADIALAIFAAECVYGRPRVRMEASYLVAEDGTACVVQVDGESGEAAARIFAGLTSLRVGEVGFEVQRRNAGELPSHRPGA